MAAVFDTLSEVYTALYTAILAAPFIGDFSTKQRHFSPTRSDLTHPSLYPWIFLHFSGMTPERLAQMPHVQQFDAVLSIVVLVHANKGVVDDLTVTQDTTNVPQGTLEYIEALKEHIYTNYKVSNFGLGQEGSLLEWQFGRAGLPNIPNLSEIVLSPYVDSKQLDIVFTVQEKRADA
jgi:hypothetical protein